MWIECDYNANHEEMDLPTTLPTINGKDLTDYIEIKLKKDESTIKHDKRETPCNEDKKKSLLHEHEMFALNSMQKSTGLVDHLMSNDVQNKSVQQEIKQQKSHLRIPIFSSVEMDVMIHKEIKDHLVSMLVSQHNIAIQHEHMFRTIKKSLSGESFVTTFPCAVKKITKKIRLNYKNELVKSWVCGFNDQNVKKTMR
jgi:hypothetical protein